jgi:hypothetical protein
MRNALAAIAAWLKDNPLLAIVGALVPVFGLVAGGPAAWAGLTQILGIPQCVTYAKVYSYSSGAFADGGDKWVESVKGVDTFTFKLAHRNPEFIILLNQTPRVGYRSDMIVRLPVCGGTAQWTLENPEHWIDLYQVWRGT